MSIKVISVILTLGMLPSTALADPAPLNLTMTNRTASAITGITANEKTAPDTVFTFAFANELAVGETDTASLNLPEGVCVIDVTYSLASGEKILQQNVDLCNIDGVIVE